MPRLRSRRRSSKLVPAAATAAALAVAGGAVAWWLWPEDAPTTAADPTPPAVAQAAPVAAAPEQPGGKLAGPAAAPAVEPLDPALLADAAALADAGRPVEARAMLNDRLLAGNLSADDERALKRQLAGIAAVVTFSPRPFEGDDFSTTFQVPPGGRLANLVRPFDVPWQAVARINGVNPRTIRAGQTLKTPRGPFHAVVDKDAFTLDLYVGAPGGPGSVYLKTYRVGLGESGSTPVGTWRVRPGGKLENPTWTNPRTGQVVAGDDPENPLGERWIALDGIAGGAVGQQSYGIHGTIEPDTIGTNASMGCVRLLNDDVAELYDYLEPGESLVEVKE